MEDGVGRLGGVLETEVCRVCRPALYANQRGPCGGRPSALFKKGSNKSVTCGTRKEYSLLGVCLPGPRVTYRQEAPTQQAAHASRLS
jgi:hypothetical protein